MSRYEIDFSRHLHVYTEPFRISGHVMDSVAAVQVVLKDSHARGRGEASGVYYLDDGVEHMMAALTEHREALENCPDREALRGILPPGGARNAVDCAMWEYESIRAGTPIWQLAGLRGVEPKITTFTLSADPPGTLAQAIARFPSTQAIKLKLDGDFDTDAARVAAVRQVCPDSWLGVDANQGYEAAGLEGLIAMLSDARVSLLEQPIRRGDEAALDGLDAPIPIAADESILCLDELEQKARYFDVLNIKLDKCGGLTEGLQLAARARELGLGVMVGNMGGSTLATAPAFVLAQVCDHVDLDGPWYIKDEPDAQEIYRSGMIDIPSGMWGA